jgi:aspartate/methionine/tyrosine aminotransferase
MEWAKHRPAVRNDLAGSNLLACTLEDLPGWRDVIDVTGVNPDGWPPLVEAIARHYGVTASRVATATGAGGANFVALAALVRAGDDVLVERPAYDPLLGALHLLGARVQRFDRVYDEGWSVDPERVRRALTPHTRLIVLTSPHNPSGVLVSDAALSEIARQAERIGARVLVDEVYLETITEHRPTAAALRADVFVSTNSLTKAYGLSGLRAGWVIATPQVAEAVRRARDVMEGTGSMPSERLAAHAFTLLPALAARARSILEPNFRTLSAFIAGRGDLEWVPPDGGSVGFPRVPGIADTRPFVDALQRERDTAVVPGAFFDAPAHIRIAWGCAAATLRAGLEQLGAALDARVR